MQTLILGKTLGAGDLSLAVRDTNGSLVAPASLSYSIFQIVNGTPTPAVDAQGPITGRTSGMVNPSTGTYYIGMTIPTSWGVGQYQVVWSLQQWSTTDPVSSITMEFYVIGVDPANTSFEAPSLLISKNPAMNPKYAPAIVMVRGLLKDTDPDKNYHFRPPTPSRVVAGYNSRVGFIWTDDEIIQNLYLSISQLNTWNPKNYYAFTLDTVPVDWGNCASLGAASWCLSGESARWAAEEFSYSLNGVSLDINKSSLYQALAESYQQKFETWAPLITANRPFSVGLRQQRWLLG
jgi:hypothetical protein